MPKDRTKFVIETNVGSAVAFNKDAIEKLAYEFWISRGCPEGSAEEDWMEAERTLLAAANAAEPPAASSGKIARKTGTAMQAAS